MTRQFDPATVDYTGSVCYSSYRIFLCPNVDEDDEDDDEVSLTGAPFLVHAGFACACVYLDIGI